MAGDWIKMESSTPDKPEVLAITVKMGWDDADMTVGKLFRVWRWFDQQTTDGNAPGVTPALLDRIAGVSGFAAAMASIGWLVITDAGISLPGFEKHNGATAKARAQTAKRVANHKANAKGNASSVTDALPREEKRRSKTSVPADAGFDEFWAGYPRKDAKQDAVKAWAKLRPDEQTQASINAGVERGKQSQQWQRDGGQYVPMPATYLNGRRWEDGASNAESWQQESHYARAK